MTFYKTKYAAYKNKTSAETVRKVDGGYMVMSWDEYYIWRAQK